MSLFSNITDDNLNNTVGLNLQTKPIGTFSENFFSAMNLFDYQESSISMNRALDDQFQPIIDIIKERDPNAAIFNTTADPGVRFFNKTQQQPGRDFNEKLPGLMNQIDGLVYPSPYVNSNPTRHLGINLLGRDTDTFIKGKANYNREVNELLAYINGNKELYPELQGITHEKIMDQAIQVAKDAESNYEEIADRSPGFNRGAMRFLGMMAGGIKDPVITSVILADVATGFGKTSLLRLMFREALIGAGTEAVLSVPVQAWYKSLGKDMTWSDFVTRVAIGASVGAAVPPTLAAAGKTISITKDQMLKGIEVLSNAKLFNKNLASTVKKVSEEEDIVAKENPLVDAEEVQPVNNNTELETRTEELKSKISAQIEHINREEDALIALTNDSAVEMPFEPVNATKVPDEILNADPGVDRAVDVVTFNLEDLNVDPKTFQYKTYDNEFGLNERLLKETSWNHVASDNLIVYEYKNGKKVVADGHQRFGLAKRLKKDSEGNPIKLRGFIYKEKDGFSPKYIRALAAVKNIMQTEKLDAKTLLDAGKVVREAPQLVERLNLGQGEIARGARHLAKISDKNFGMVINNIVPSTYAAKVGEFVGDDPVLQDAAMIVLAKTKPSSTQEAEFIVRQIASESVEVKKQTSLFGDEFVADSVYLEKARLVKNVLSQLKLSKNILTAINKNKQLLENQGNAIATERNVKRIEGDNLGLFIIDKLSFKAGTKLSEKFNEQAKRFKNTEQSNKDLNTITGDIIEYIRSGVERGDLAESIPGFTRPTLTNTPKGSKRPDPTEEIAEFEPGSARSVDQANELETSLFEPRNRPQLTEKSTAESVTKVLSTKNLSTILRNIIRLDSPNTIKELFFTDKEFAKELGGEIKAGKYFVNYEGPEITNPISDNELNSVKKEIYDLTQELLKDLPEEINIYRSGKLNDLDGVSSFTLNPNYNIKQNLPWQEMLGDPLVAYKVKKKDILASPDIAKNFAGGRAFDEDEVIVDNNTIKDQSTNLQDPSPTPARDRSTEEAGSELSTSPTENVGSAVQVDPVQRIGDPSLESANISPSISTGNVINVSANDVSQKIYTSITNISEIFKKARETDIEANKILQKFEGVKFKTRIKNEETTQKKLTRPGRTTSDPRSISDYLGARVLPKGDDFVKAEQFVEDNFVVLDKDFKDFLGTTHYQVKLRPEDNFSFEIQVRPNELEDIITKHHNEVYTPFRDKTGGGKQEGTQKLTKKEREFIKKRYKMLEEAVKPARIKISEQRIAASSPAKLEDPENVEDLFADLDQQIPDMKSITDDGTMEFKTIRNIQEDIVQDQVMLDRLRGCV